MQNLSSGSYEERNIHHVKTNSVSPTWRNWHGRFLAFPCCALPLRVAFGDCNVVPKRSPGLLIEASFSDYFWLVSCKPQPMALQFVSITIRYRCLIFPGDDAWLVASYLLRAFLILSSFLHFACWQQNPIVMFFDGPHEGNVAAETPWSPGKWKICS